MGMLASRFFMPRVEERSQPADSLGCGPAVLSALAAPVVYAADPPPETPPEVEPPPAPLSDPPRHRRAQPPARPRRTGTRFAPTLHGPHRPRQPHQRPKTGPLRRRLKALIRAGRAGALQNIESLIFKRSAQRARRPPAAGTRRSARWPRPTSTISREEIAAHGWRSLGVAFRSCPACT